ncbi:hypothetical protein M0813_06276 [Anaeramoeba flamelloides]|uniref:PH domain-containing protein n=1 Tax=Anaeramoeba flamelloides TaxID=1746091 RepID=A0ABQ8XEK7_9EUKA|nr:hypothetical protein M0813_06276 [Anaeramoeba flamelloides]
MSNSSSVYLCGSQETSFNFVTQEKKNNLPKWTESQIKKTQTIKKIVCGKSSYFLVWKKPNKLEFYKKDNKKRKYQLPKNEIIKDIVSSFKTFLILTESGRSGLWLRKIVLKKYLFLMQTKVPLKRSGL